MESGKVNIERPRALVIAGFDPSGGAGVLADIKTMEALGVYGYAVCTGMTWQNERSIKRVEWYDERDICEQINLCSESGAFDWVKIGIGRSVGMIAEIVAHLRRRHPGVRIVLDPVIRASSGRNFWEGLDTEAFEALAASCYLVTPNWDEMIMLYPGAAVMESCQRLSYSCNLYLKGGHNPQHPGRDYLCREGKVEVLEPDASPVFNKHGSGCVLSSALTSNLALGYSLPAASIRSKRYIEKFLSSNKTLLGWH